MKKNLQKNKGKTNNLNTNKNSKIIIIAIIIIVIIGVVVYFAFIKNNNNGQGTVGGSKYEDSTEYKTVNLDNHIEDLKNNSDLKNIKYAFHEVVENFEYRELDGGNGDILIKLTEDGKISLKYDENDSITISNVSKVKDFVSVLYGNYVYIITNNGDVYKFMPKDENYKDKAIKLTKINNADKFVYISYSIKDTLYITTILGIVDTNNNYIELADITGL